MAVSLESYRREARQWLRESMPRRKDRRAPHDVAHYTKEVISYNRSLQRRLFEAGYAGISWPEEYGGQGLPEEYESAFLEEALEFNLPDFGVLSGTTFKICVPTMIACSPPGFLRAFIPQVLAGDQLICQFFSEPSSGSDLAGIRTSAVRRGEDWLLNGQKAWSTFAHLADSAMCLARTDWDAPKHQGLTWFLVPCASRGLTIRSIIQIDESSAFCEEFLDDVIVPDSQRLSEVGDGWSVAQTMFVFERGGGGASSLRLEGPGAIAPNHVEVARRVKRLNDPVVRQKIAAAHVSEYVGKALRFRIGQLRGTEQISPSVASYVKLFEGTYVPKRARLLVEIGGPGGISWRASDPRGEEYSEIYLRSRSAAVAGGTNETQRNVIGERVLNLPREPSFDHEVPFREALKGVGQWFGAQR